MGIVMQNQKSLGKKFPIDVNLIEATAVTIESYLKVDIWPKDVTE